MKRAIVERNMAIVMFVLVLITFSFAQRDSKRIIELYTTTEKKPAKLASAAPAVSGAGTTAKQAMATKGF